MELMELSVILHDHEEVPHNKFRTKLHMEFSTKKSRGPQRLCLITTCQSTLKELKQKIDSVLQINHVYQYLYVEGKKLDAFSDTSLRSLGMKHGSVIVVKHALIENWDVILQRLKRFRNLRSNEEKEDMAPSLLKMVDRLKKENFFACYVEFFIPCDQICLYVRSYLGGFRESIEMAARYFFFDLKKNYRPNDFIFKISFDDKLAGVHSGRLCTVTDYDGTTTYYIKTNHGAPRNSRSQCGIHPNLREIFGYVLLQLIGVGPESHFLCPPPGTSIGTIFIATKAIPNFERNRMDELSSRSKNI